jgi:hypothetical protein
MLQVNVGNIITIALAGMLGYALLAGIPKLQAVLTGSSTSS